MPQPHLPAPLAQRPEPGAQLLEAVRERQTERSLQLAQQWVHRRGIVDLQRFCNGELSSALGQEAVLWLQGLLELDAPLSPDQSAEPRLPTPASANAQATAEQTTGVVREAVSAPMAPGPAPLSAAHTSAAAPTVQDREAIEQELQSRAVAAVDEAFAALAQTFQEESISVATPPDPTPAPLSFAIEASASRTSGPQPLPVRVGLWPSLRASAASLGAALRAGSGGGRTALDVERNSEPDVAAAATPPDEEMTPMPGALSSVETAEEASSDHEAETGAEAGTTELPQAQIAAGEPAEAVASTGDVDHPDAAALLASEADEQAAGPAAACAVPQQTRRAGLLQRLRGRIRRRRLPRLTRVRAVMRDCFEETISLLRTPEPEFNDTDFEDELLLEPLLPLPASPVQEPPLTLPVRPPARLSWSIEPSVPPAPEAVGDNSDEPAVPSRPSAASAADHGSDHAVDTAAEPAAMPAAISPLRPGPIGSQPAGRPNGGSSRPAAPRSAPAAPAPASLSDLRAWLPDRGNLPKAS